jgi:hypothetical protein
MYIDGVTDANITAGTIYLGNGSTGNVRSTAGTVTVSSNLYVGESYAGTYTLAGGSLTGAAAMTVATTGTFTGRGTVGLTGSLTNNGKVTADGNNADATLSLASFNSVLNTTENTDGYGWFATNKGKLILPALAITAGYPMYYNWGEAAGDTDIDLVNSLRFTATEGFGAGSLTICLLDKDWSETPVAALTDAHYPALGIWEFGSPNRFTQANLTVRYDNASSGLTPEWLPGGTEATLVLGRAYPEGGGWSWRVVNWGPQIDTGKHQLIQTGVPFSADGATYLAVVQGFPGDCDLTGCVDVTDLLIFVDAFGTSRDDPEGNPPGKVYDPATDFNADGYVDVTDLLTLVYAWGLDQSGTACSSAAPPGEFQAMMQADDEGGTFETQRRASLYQALEQTGLLDVWQDYVTEHPEADL